MNTFSQMEMYCVREYTPTCKFNICKNLQFGVLLVTQLCISDLIRYINTDFWVFQPYSFSNKKP